jgi:Sec-independent protein translocase protein TatA
MIYKPKKLPDRVLKARQDTIEKKYKWNENPFIQDIQHRLRNLNQNMLVCIVGAPGYGKSYAGAMLCEQVDPGFYVDRIAFADPLDFMELTAQEFPKGSAIMWDEVGVGLDNRNFFDIMNKSITYIAQTFRDQNHLVVFTVPESDFTDKKLRDLFHVIIWMTGIKNTRYGFSLGKWLIQGRTPFTKGKTKMGAYLKYPRVHGQRIPSIRFYKPTPELVKDYEKAARKFKKELRQQKYEEMKKLSGKEEETPLYTKTKSMNMRELYELINKDRMKYVDDTGVFDPLKIQYELGVSEPKSNKIIDMFNRIKKQ